MRGHLPVVTLAAAITLAATAATAQEFRQPGVHLSIDAHGWLKNAEIDMAVDQIRQIWGTAGVGVSSGGHGGSWSLDDARVSVRMLITPAREHATSGTIVMGWVARAQDGTVGPTMFVSLAGIERVLSRRHFYGVSYLDLPLSFRSRIIARAVGRVVAHEIGHYLLQSALHSGKGLMRPEFTAAALGDQEIDSFLLGPRESALLRREVATLALAQRQNATR